MNIKLCADGALDLNLEMYQKYSIQILPITITIDNESFKDNLDIPIESIYQRVENGSDIPKTAATNLVEYFEFFQQFDEDDFVIYLTLGSGFSSAYQNAVLAAREFDNIHVVDTQNLSLGMGYLAVKAGIAIKQGLEGEAVLQRLETLIPKVSVSLIIDKLDYVRKGGRVKALTQVGVETLKLHPSIAIIENELKVLRLFRGNIHRAALKYAKAVVNNIQAFDPQLLFVASSSKQPQLVNEIVELIRQEEYFNDIQVAQTGITVSSHTGPNAIGIIGSLK